MIGYAFLAVIVLIGSAATASDWRRSRVPNRLAVLGLAAFAGGVAYRLAGSALGSLGLRWLFLGELYMPWRFYPLLGAHALLSAAAGWVLWRMDVWPAGDAKLYIVLSWLLPLADSNLSGFPLLLFMVFLVNCFVPSGLVFAGEAVVRLAAAVPPVFSRGVGYAVKSTSNRLARRIRDMGPIRLESAALVFNLGCLFFLMPLAQMSLHRRPLGPFGELMIFLAMLLVWQWLSALLHRPRLGAAAFVGFCACAAYCVFAGLDLGGLLWRTAKTMVSFGCFLSLARLAVDQVIEPSSVKAIAPEELRPGTLLSNETWEALCRDENARGIVEERNCDGLTAGEADALRGRLTARGERSLSVYRTVPFAAWIFLGAILTLAHRGTVVSWARDWMTP